MVEFDIRQLGDLPDEVDFLVLESEAEGFRFLTRLKEDWITGENRFDLPGERLFGAFPRGRLVGICGLNRDPYQNDVTVGRVRRMYVSPRDRRTGIGRALVERVIDSATVDFDWLQLRSQPGAASFFTSLGFDTVADDPVASHRMRLQKS